MGGLLAGRGAVRWGAPTCNGVGCVYRGLCNGGLCVGIGAAQWRGGDTALGGPCVSRAAVGRGAAQLRGGHACALGQCTGGAVRMQWDGGYMHAGGGWGGGGVSNEGAGGVCIWASPLSPQTPVPPLTWGPRALCLVSLPVLRPAPPPSRAPSEEETAAGAGLGTSSRGCHGPSCRATNANPVQTRPLPQLCPTTGHSSRKGARKPWGQGDGDLQAKILVPVIDQCPLVWVPAGDGQPLTLVLTRNHHWRSGQPHGPLLLGTTLYDKFRFFLRHVQMPRPLCSPRKPE